MKNVLKIALLGIIGIFALTYITADKPQSLNAQETNNAPLSYDKLPADFELVGKDKRIAKEMLFKQGTKSLIIVGNHDSLAVVKELPKYADLNVPYVMVANISSAPWFVKKMFIPGKLEELNSGSTIPMIYDFDGDMVKSLKVVDNAKTKFTAYMLNEDGTILHLHVGTVKEGAMDGSMNDLEKKEALQPVINVLK